jgi:5-methylcytosine-specific restriction endonuclease McrA
MPFALQPACPVAGCRQRKPCPEHRPQTKPRPSAAARGYDRKWRLVRAAFLKANGWCIEPGCGLPATEADHVIALKDGGTHSWSNLRPFCKPHHSRRTAKEQPGGWNVRERRAPGSPTCPVTLVCGPPGSGKSTYVDERRQWGDLVIDLDTLYMALSGLPAYEKPDVLLPFVFAAKDAVLARLAGGHGLRHAWVITSGADGAERKELAARLNAGIVLLDVAPSECLRRISQDARRHDKWEKWIPIIDRWWKRFTTSR